jgi:hypothetical protein
MDGHRYDVGIDCRCLLFYPGFDVFRRKLRNRLARAYDQKPQHDDRQRRLECPWGVGRMAWRHGEGLR